MTKNYIKYSYYVYLNKMCGILQEAVIFLVDNPDDPEASGILSSCADSLKTIKKFLCDHKNCCLNQEIFTLLDALEAALSRYRDDKSSAEALTEKVGSFCSWFKGGLRYKIHAVFYTDLGEKWDALESVYKAFQQRDDCEVTVVIMPVFRVDREGKPLPIYEDYLTPIGVPYVESRNYSLQKDCPDLVFHTNPYAGTIPPGFAARDVVKYTRLVYLCYYTDDIMDKETLQTTFKLPMADIAWRIPLMSDKMMRLHEKYAPKHGDNAIVTGSAKWDGIVNTIQNGCDKIPAWDEKLAGKKVFLWNSHFNLGNEYASTLMQMGEFILNYFGSRPHLGLIWRPHPMTETVIKAQYESVLQLWNSWNQYAQNSANIVIDTHKSFGPAFYYADAMLSDRSSMIPQFMLTGKPVLFLKRTDFSRFEKVVDLDCLEEAYSFDDCKTFINQVINGEDPNRERRMKVIKEDMGLADGHCGERICERVIEDMKKEDGVI